MKIRNSFWLALLAIVLAATTGVTAAEMGTQGVSPGATDRMALVGTACPTFSWEVNLEAEHYELLVYQLSTDTAGVAEIDLGTATEVLFTTVPGRATSWTPELEDCFSSGGRYVWFIRAVGYLHTGTAGEWSKPRLFEIAQAPSRQQVREAIEVLARFVESDAEGADLGTLLAESFEPVARDESDHIPSTRKTTSTGDRSVTTGIAAIRGEQPDLSGETYGVVGISASPDGAGLGAANTAGGPDLVLDGAVPAEFSEAGVDRPSGTAQTFSFGNSGGGGMTLDIGGIEIVTTATDQDTVGALSCASGELAKWSGAAWVCDSDLDSDTVGALTCSSGELAKWNGAAWVCDSDLDTNTDTLNALDCSSGEVAKWNGAEWVCAVDDDTVFTVGTGLVLNGREISLDPAYFPLVVSTLDDEGLFPTGRYTSVAIGSDGLGLISHFSRNAFKVAHCNDAACTSATVSTLDDSVAEVGYFTSITIGTDGLGLISFCDWTNKDLKVAHCDDVACASATVSTLDSQDTAGYNTSIAIGADGLGLISYYYHDGTTGHLRVAHCNDAACTSAEVSTVDSTGDVGWYTAIAIGSDGLGLISYRDVANWDLKVAHCNDAACTSATVSTVDSAGNVGDDTSIAIGSDGLGLISYRYASTGDLRVAHCEDVACTVATISTVDSAGDVGYHTSIAIDADGLGLISYQDVGNQDLRVIHCGDTDCTYGASLLTLDSEGEVGEYTSIAVDGDGVGLISYYDKTNKDLKAAHLPSWF